MENIKDICKHNNHSAIDKSRKGYQLKIKLSIHLTIRPRSPLYHFVNRNGCPNIIFNNYIILGRRPVNLQFDKTVCGLLCVKSSKFFALGFSRFLFIFTRLAFYSIETFSLLLHLDLTSLIFIQQ